MIATPGGMFANDGIFVIHQGFEKRQMGARTRIPDGHGHIAEKSTTLGALDGVLLEPLLKLLRRQLREFFERRGDVVRGSKAGPPETRRLRFQGQTSWQMSQPKTCLPIKPLSPGSMESFTSMVR